MKPKTWQQNTEERWIVRIVRTKQVVARFRLQLTATGNLPRLRDMYHGEDLEVVLE